MVLRSLGSTLSFLEERQTLLKIPSISDLMALYFFLVPGAEKSFDNLFNSDVIDAALFVVQSTNAIGSIKVLGSLPNAWL